MTETVRLLRHLLAALAYRTQKALRDAPPSFGSFRAAPKVRTPQELVCHMTSVLGYARTFLVGGSFRPELLPTLDEEVARFHETLAALDAAVVREEEWKRISPRQLLQGPLSDAMTHSGQLAMLRRLAGSPIAPENFIYAEVDAENLTARQALPAAPDADWPERPESD